MGFFGSLKKFMIETFSDDPQPLVCTNCGWYPDGMTNHFANGPKKPIQVCNTCGAENSISFVGTLPVCRNCHSHSYYIKCPKCGQPME